MESPIGQLKLVASDTGLAAILWEQDRPDRVRLNIVGEDQSIRCWSRPSASSKNISAATGRLSR